MFKSTQFGELIKGLPRKAFSQFVNDQKADKYSKGFSSYDHLVAMVFAQISGCQSLRELETAFNSQSAHHYHLGTKEIKRSTLSDANTNRNSKVFESVCQHLMQGVHRSLRNEIQDLLYLMDASGIRLSGKGFDDWTETTERHRIHGLKMHVIYACQKQVPIKVELTGGGTQDVEKRHMIRPEPGATYAFDKGYYDYNWWHELHQSGAYFVTRFKKNASMTTMESKKIPKDLKDIVLEDSKVKFKKVSDKRRRNDYAGTPLRKIVINRPDKGSSLVLATNDFERSAEEIAAIYKKRWAIELFFKWIKQNLKIKKYLGRSKNAVEIQIFTAIISYLLTHLMHKNQGSRASLKLFLIELRSTLFSRMDIDRRYERKRRKVKQEFDARQYSLAL